ncbi:nitrite reductase small subunit NirD [Pseudoalteromonas denitrificans]|uniref:Assimilatory nitrite reductase (NAD(P)H) small subunit n=1 Tax=Pseudoalteromonas denitrificans DSM 6059 TaxID=1123010 RepID=A0A1I1U4I6_9GAMM|nr:nitrite reductase small subunit NirD [Pseudoalteromonas denitrificans]SFD64528.1 assimilatory nitrite reductase (NAD(P)H) small subunit [Pseudoalteromonas denitrificans DSM 6059]
MKTTQTNLTTNWQTVCQQNDLVNDSGICALIENQQIALFYLKGKEQVFAITNYDPIGRANVLYRGILGCINNDIVVSSPLYKQHFSLVSGQCLQDEKSKVTVFETRIINQEVQVKIQVQQKVA